ncbi:phosphatidate cytidylyltransferase [Candidatus Pelagibacter sp.]|jgi:phosphatidate cytidylyltransferase|nr:phosphatidate cytidylyltransferase [Candidatus Pelagibacter sp.]
MSKELKKRIFTSIILLASFFLMIKYSYILLIGLIFFTLIIWIEFNSLINRIIKSKKNILKVFTFLTKILALFYISYFCYIAIIHLYINQTYKIIFLFLIGVCIVSDIGGLVFGKLLKGKKLTKISPNKTISGSIGSFIFSLMLIPVYYQFDFKFSFLELFFITLLTSLFSQVGDLFISYLKRKAKVKDTGDLLPGHGGFLDRFDGILFGVPFGLFFISII